MQLLPLYMGLLDPLYKLFGYIMSLLYAWIGNYGLVVIIFTLILRSMTMFVSMKGRRGTLQQSKLQSEMTEIQRLYPDDPQKQNELRMELFKANNISPMSGCLSSILGFVLILAIWRPVQQPLHYIAGISQENLAEIADMLQTRELIDANAVKMLSRNDIPVLSALRSSASALAEAINEGYMKLSQLIDLDFMGMDLGLKPTVNPKLLFGEDASTYLPLLIFPVLTIITMVISMRLGKLSQPGMTPADRKERERAEKNPARAGQVPEAPGANMMKTMNITMPIFMLFTVFSLPSAMGVYWTVSNILNIIETLIFYNLYIKPGQKLATADTVLTNSSYRKIDKKESVVTLPETSTKKSRKKGDK